MRKLVALACLLTVCATSQAVVVTESHPEGDVQFTYDNDTPFGPGSVMGNSIYFAPEGFKAESIDGDGTDTLNVTLNVTIEVKAEAAGYVLENFTLVEEGHYKLNGSGASVSANGLFRILSETQSCGGFFPCRESNIFDAGPLTVANNTPHLWSVGAFIDLADTPDWDPDTEVLMTLQNLLTATTTTSGETALIQKNLQGVGIIVNFIPIPGAVWLFGSAFGWLAWMRRRSR